MLCVIPLPLNNKSFLFIFNIFFINSNGFYVNRPITVQKIQEAKLSSSTTIVNSASLTSRIFIGQLKQKPSEVVKKNNQKLYQVATVWHETL